METGHLVVGFHDIVSLQNGCKHGETIFVIELSIITVSIDACYFYLITRLGTINEIGEKNNLSLAWKTTCRNRTRGFLQRQFLIIPVDCLLGTQRKWSSRLTVLAAGYLD